MSSFAEVTAARNAISSSFTVGDSSAFIPVADRVYVAVMASSAGASVGTATASGLGGLSGVTFTEITPTGAPSVANRVQAFRFTAPSSPTSGQVRFTMPASQVGGVVQVYELSSDVTESMFVASAGNAANSAAASVDIGSPAADSTAMGVMYYVATGTITEGAGYTKVGEWTVFSTVKVVGFYDSDAPTDGVVDAALGSSSNWYMVGWEIEASAGGSSITGSGDLTLPAAELSGSGTITSPPGSVTGSGDLELPAMEFSGEGTVVGNRTGSGDLNLPALEMSGSGTVTSPSGSITGSGDLELPALEMSGSGTVTSPPGSITGSGDLTLPAVEMSGSGAVTGGAPDNPEGVPATTPGVDFFF